MNESGYIQYEIDLLTGYQTAIFSDAVSEGIRSACTALNRQRTRGILEAAKYIAPSEQVQTNVWATTFERQSQQWEAPLVSLNKLGITHDADGFVSTSFLEALTTGAEASPYLDTERKVVYKLFDLRANGSLGKKILLDRETEGTYKIKHNDATFVDTMEKLSVLNDAGGHITEIVGLSDDGNYLVAKQPLAYPYNDFQLERDIAVNNLKGIVPFGPSLGHVIAITWTQESAWMVGDLHTGNIMIDSNGNPTVIDALTGTIPTQAPKEVNGLAYAIQDARDYRVTNQIPLRKAFDDVNNDEL